MIDTKRTVIEVLSETHTEKMLKYYQDNRVHLSPWEPLRADNYLTLENWIELARASKNAFQQGSEYKFVALTKDKSEIVGVCNFTGVVRGVFQACFLGFSVAEKYARQGYMTEILSVAIDYMFNIVGLNRVMATYMPANEASGRVLAKLGFEREGYARKYLKIAGNWEDHILTSKISERT